jgi:hypothetical protein
MMFSLIGGTTALVPLPWNNSGFAKISRWNHRLDDLWFDQSYAVNARFGTRRNRLSEPCSDKMRASAVIERKRRWESALD